MCALHTLYECVRVCTVHVYDVCCLACASIWPARQATAKAVCVSLSLSLLGCVHVYVRNLGVSLFFLFFSSFGFGLKTSNGILVLYYLWCCVYRAQYALSPLIFETVLRKRVSICVLGPILRITNNNKKSLFPCYMVFTKQLNNYLSLSICANENKNNTT